MKNFVHIRLSSLFSSYSAQSSGPNKETDRFPGMSQVSGLLANAMGYDHRDYDKKEELLNNLKFVSFREANLPNRVMRDYQTVRRNDDVFIYNNKKSNTTKIEESDNAIALQNKYYYQDYYVDILLQVSSIEPENIRDFLVSPSRVLFVGRKCAVPNIQIFQRIVKADSFNSAIVEIIHPAKKYLAEWMHGLLVDDHIVKSIQSRARNDIRDPREDTIGGSRLVVLGTFN